MNNLLIKNAKIVNEGNTFKGDILIENDTIHVGICIKASCAFISLVKHSLYFLIIYVIKRIGRFDLARSHDQAQRDSENTKPADDKRYVFRFEAHGCSLYSHKITLQSIICKKATTTSVVMAFCSFWNELLRIGRNIYVFIFLHRRRLAVRHLVVGHRLWRLCSLLCFGVA